MPQETRQIFGISPVIESGRQHHVFLQVIGEVTDSKLALLPNAREEFPTEGNVYVESKFWVPEGVGAVWKVRRTRTAAEGARQAEYAAVARGLVLPFEIISIPQQSNAPAAVREYLLHGEDLGYVPASSILIQLSDGPVVGPVRCEPLPNQDGYGYRCRPESLNDLLGYWPSASALGAVSFIDSERVARQFTAYLTLPQTESFFDCAPLDHVVRSVLRTVRESDALALDVNKRHMDGIARVVSELSAPAKVAGRAERVVRALEGHSMAQPALEALREHLLQSPAVEKELAGIREKAKTDAAEELTRQQHSLKDSIASLSSQRDQLKAQLKDLTDQVRKAEHEVKTTVDRVAENIREKVAEAAREPAKLLSEIALFRHFIGEPQRAAPTTEPVSPRPVPGPRTEIATPADLVAVLEQNLTAAGLAAGSARRVAREVCASAKAGQATVFGGSIANELARASAAAFAGEQVYEYQVPIGLLDGAEVARHLSAISRSSQAENAVAVLILEGMNRSAFEAYAEDVRAYVAGRQLPGKVTSSVVILGTLTRGPSALRVGPEVCEVGPVIDTDCLALATKPSSSVKSGRIGTAAWLEWSDEAVAKGGRIDTIDEALLRAIEGEESLLWRRTISNAYAALTSTGSGGSTPLQSLIYGWLVPRAYSSGVPREQFVPALVELAGTGDDADPRLKRLLSRLLPEPAS